MKYSELDINTLSEKQIYDLVMSEVRDYAKVPVDEAKSPDLIIVLGAAPAPMKPRVIKSMELFKLGYGKYIALSGGKGWHKLFVPDHVEMEKLKYDIDAQGEYVKKKLKCAKHQERVLRGIIPNQFKQNKKGTRGYGHSMRVQTKKMLQKSEADIASLIIKEYSEIAEIDPTKVFLEEDSSNTVENMINSMEMMRKVDDIKSVMIVTSCFHCKRAELTFKKYFPDVEVRACPSTLELTSNNRTLTRESLMSGEDYYKRAIRRELQGIIAYTRNGTIADEEIKNSNLFVNMINLDEELDGATPYTRNGTSTNGEKKGNDFPVNIIDLDAEIEQELDL